MNEQCSLCEKHSAEQRAAEAHKAGAVERVARAKELAVVLAAALGHELGGEWRESMQDLNASDCVYCGKTVLISTRESDVPCSIFGGYSSGYCQPKPTAESAGAS